MKKEYFQIVAPVTTFSVRVALEQRQHLTEKELGMPITARDSVEGHAGIGAGSESAKQRRPKDNEKRTDLNNFKVALQF